MRSIESEQHTIATARMACCPVVDMYVLGATTARQLLAEAPPPRDISAILGPRFFIAAQLSPTLTRTIVATQGPRETSSN
jgi:hypothetical protein